MDKITIALAKGRLAEKSVALLEQCGIDCRNILEPTRKLILTDKSGNYEFIFVKPSDVPTYVEYGVADIGFVGKDTLMELDKNVYELLDLKIAKCKLCIAGYPNSLTIKEGETLKVATKYTNIAKKLFESRGQNIELITLHGSIELGPIVKLSHVIFDIVESGKTLIENDLQVLEEIFDISARLIANKVSLKTRANVIMPLVAKLKELV